MLPTVPSLSWTVPLSAELLPTRKKPEHYGDNYVHYFMQLDIMPGINTYRTTKLDSRVSTVQCQELSFPTAKASPLTVKVVTP